MAMDEVEMSIRPGKVERTALPSMARRRRRIPANAVVCLWDGKIVNVLRRGAELRGEAYNLASCQRSQFTICGGGCGGYCSACFCSRLLRWVWRTLRILLCSGSGLREGMVTVQLVCRFAVRCGG